MSIEEQQEAVQEMHLAQQIAEHVARILMSGMQPYPEFGPGGVPMEVAAKVYGKDALWVREGIDAGWLPIGRSERKTGAFTYRLRNYGKTRGIYGKERTHERYKNF